MAKRSLLVIGGGFAGLEVATSLAGDLNVTLVDVKAYFEYTPGVLRCLVEPEHLSEVTLAYATVAERYHFTFLQGEVLELSEHSATVRTVDATQQLEFDYAAICCGSGYEEPIRPRKGFEDTLGDRQVNIEEWREDIKQCSKILIVGGGTVGVELAGEIVSYFPDKQLALATSDSRLIKEMPQAASAYAHVFLVSRGVKIEYNRRMNETEMRDFDLVFKCVGVQMRSQFMNSKFAHVLTQRGGILVNACLQVQGYSHLFAIGDCATTPISEPKTAYFAEEMAMAAATNIRALVNGREPTPLPDLDHFPMMSSVSLGPDYAITIFNSLVLGGRLQSFMKVMLEKLKMRFFTSSLAAAMRQVAHFGALCANKIIA